MSCAGTEQSLRTQLLGAERAPQPVECPPARWGFPSLPADHVTEQGSAWFCPAFGWGGQSTCGCFIAQKGRTIGQHPAPGFAPTISDQHVSERWPGKKSSPGDHEKAWPTVSRPLAHPITPVPVP